MNAMGKVAAKNIGIEDQKMTCNKKKTELAYKLSDNATKEIGNIKKLIHS